MKHNSFSQIIRIPYSLWWLSTLVFLFSFYPFNPTIETGLDPSYAFGLNYIFAHHIPFGTTIIYTYGPLGFLNFPQDIGSNFLIGVLLVSALRFIFIYAFLKLGSCVNKNFWLLHTFFAFIICSFVYLDFILVGAVTLFVLLHFHEQRKLTLVVAALLTVLALLIKSSFGLMCGSILFSYTVYDYLMNRKFNITLILLASGIFFLVLIWLILYGNLNGIYNYFYGTWQLSTGNSSAMILEVKNNWWLLSLFGISFFLVPVWMKDKGVTLLYFISFLSLYAAWKYAFSREENYHLKFFFDYLILFFALFLVVSKHFKPQLIALLLASIFVFFQSMKATGMYTLQEEVSFSGFRNFTTWVFNSDKIRAESQAQSQQNLLHKKLPNELLNKIGNASIDFFPWELTYVAANNLNWNPRPNMQSGAYTPWLDMNNANFIASKMAPKFYLWEMDKPNGGVNCFDERYLLNDEPCTIFTLFNNYKIVYADSNQTLFQKTDKPVFSLLVEGDLIKTNWNTWIKIPEDTSGVIRIKATLENNFTGKFRKAIFKDIIYFMDYKFADKTVSSYRIVRDNAVNGLWVNPLIERINYGLNGKRVDSVRFRCSNANLVTDSISFQWQIITLAENQHTSKNDN